MKKLLLSAARIAGVLACIAGAMFIGIEFVKWRAFERADAACQGIKMGSNREQITEAVRNIPDAQFDYQAKYDISVNLWDHHCRLILKDGVHLSEAKTYGPPE